MPDNRAGFDRLALGLERLKEESINGVRTVAVSPAFAAKCLLQRFHTAWPDTDVRLDTSLKPVDFVAQRIDIGVRSRAARVCRSRDYARSPGFRRPAKDRGSSY